MFWRWKGPNEIFKYLGIPFAANPSTKVMWEWVFDKIQKKHVKWKTRYLSLVGRV